MNDYPDSFVAIQLHIGDSYATSWTSQRANFYGVSGTPTTWFDGLLECVGAYASDTQMYNWYNQQRAARAAVPTDVTIELTGVETGSQTYDITATVGIEAGGVGKEMKLHFVQALDYYPSYYDDRYRNCVIQHEAGGTYTLAAGESVTVTIPFTLSGASWTYKEDVKMVVFAREPGTPAPKEIYNVGVMGWPFTSPSIDGDVDGDGDVDLTDLAGLLATYGLCAGDAGYNDDADFIDDDCIDLSDLAVLLANYGYGP
ncbi:MAG: hypothetical protein KKI02_02295 [Planctomycetes bacterium]|nr:hypothetical protein [Planctomycetota bacterium]